MTALNFTKAWRNITEKFSKFQNLVPNEGAPQDLTYPFLYLHLLSAFYWEFSPNEQDAFTSFLPLSRFLAHAPMECNEHVWRTDVSICVSVLMCVSTHGWT